MLFHGRLQIVADEGDTPWLMVFSEWLKRSAPARKPVLMAWRQFGYNAV